MDLSTFANLAGCSPFHLLRSFKAAYHETSHRYQMGCRLERAKALLAEDRLSVTDICFEVGFESLGSFSALFKEKVGWPPSIYKAQVLAQRRRPAQFIPHCYVFHYGLKLPPAIPEKPGRE